jgi:hypothetical protein
VARPYVVDFDTGFYEAILALIRGWRDGVYDVVNTPRIGYERHGNWGKIAGTVIGVANGIVKPLAGTMASLTWFCRGIYANIKNHALADKGLEALPINTLGLESSLSTSDRRERFPLNTDINKAVKSASKITGFSPEVCRQIISDFDSIKEQRSTDRSHWHKSQ